MSLRWHCSKHVLSLTDFSDCQTYLSEVLRNQNKINWALVTQDLVGTLPAFEKGHLPVHPKNLDSFVINTCAIVERPDAALDYVTSNDLEVSLNGTQMTSLLRILARSQKMCDKQLVLNLCRQILDNMDTIPESAKEENVSCAIAAMAKAGEWQEALQHLENQPATSTALLRGAATVAIQALKAGRPEKFWDVVRMPHFQMRGYHCMVGDMNHLSEELQSEVFVAYINSKYSDEQFFKFCASSGYSLRKSVVDAITAKYGRKLSKANALRKNGVCRTCGEQLNELELSQEECDALKNGLFNLIWDKQDVYSSTTPREFNSVYKAIKKIDYDFVVDGLNVGLARMPKVKRKTVEMQSFTLYKTLVEICKRDYKVLLIHRPEIKRFPHYTMIKKLVADCIILDSTTADDIFSLLAALDKGPGTLLISNDQFRQYNFQLENPYLRSLFLKWQLRYQVRHYFRSGDSHAHIIFPPRHTSWADEGEKHWHLPILPERSSDDLEKPKVLVFSRQWLCIKKGHF